jgi:hypothetical protein
MKEFCDRLKWLFERDENWHELEGSHLCLLGKFDANGMEEDGNE